jgi:hypothetical protein
MVVVMVVVVVKSCAPKSALMPVVVMVMVLLLLLLFHLRHPASGYVQGMNDLVTPFLAVFLSEQLQGPLESWQPESITEVGVPLGQFCCDDLLQYRCRPVLAA